MTRCPTCDSPAPNLHPAVQAGGEVQPCRDAYHEPLSDDARRALDATRWTPPPGWIPGGELSTNGPIR